MRSSPGGVIEATNEDYLSLFGGSDLAGGDEPESFDADPFSGGVEFGSSDDEPFSDGVEEEDDGDDDPVFL